MLMYCSEEPRLLDDKIVIHDVVVRETYESIIDALEKFASEEKISFTMAEHIAFIMVAKWLELRQKQS